VLVVGHEELGVPVARLRSAQDEKQVITIPHEGCKESLNVGVAAGIALSWWTIRR
jgi:tRNA G18 (ribose-2'-O)-methylase SpoU